MSKSAESDAKRSGTKTLVEKGSVRRPFMRGIMVHSLMARGLSFDEAYRVASHVREKVRARAVVPRAELTDLIGEVIDTSDLEHPLERTREIVVMSGDKGTPFSKGFLSQSLLAAALDPALAFELAREIEEDLRKMGATHVERSELRRISFAKIRDRVGPRKAERYLVWRQFQEPERPVILLLGGDGRGQARPRLPSKSPTASASVAGAAPRPIRMRQIMRIMLSRGPGPRDPRLVLRRLARYFQTSTAWATIPSIEGFRDAWPRPSVGRRSSAIDRSGDLGEREPRWWTASPLVPGMIDRGSRTRDHARCHLPAWPPTLDAEAAYADRFSHRARSAESSPAVPTATCRTSDSDPAHRAGPHPRDAADQPPRARSSTTTPSIALGAVDHPPRDGDTPRRAWRHRCCEADLIPNRGPPGLGGGLPSGGLPR